MAKITFHGGRKHGEFMQVPDNMPQILIPIPREWYSIAEGPPVPFDIVSRAEVYEFTHTGLVDLDGTVHALIYRYVSDT